MDPTELLHSTMPFCKTLGVRGLRYGPDAVEAELDWAAELCTSDGMLHGGVLMSLADATGGACAFANLPDDAAGTATIESKTNFLGAVRGGTVRATSTALHRGRATIVVETELRDGAGKLVGKTTQTQTVLRPRP